MSHWFDTSMDVSKALGFNLLISFRLIPMLLTHAVSQKQAALWSTCF